MDALDDYDDDPVDGLDLALHTMHTVHGMRPSRNRRPLRFLFGSRRWEPRDLITAASVHSDRTDEISPPNSGDFSANLADWLPRQQRMAQPGDADDAGDAGETDAENTPDEPNRPDRPNRPDDADECSSLGTDMSTATLTKLRVSALNDRRSAPGAKLRRMTDNVSYVSAKRLDVPADTRDSSDSFSRADGSWATHRRVTDVDGVLRSFVMMEDSDNGERPEPRGGRNRSTHRDVHADGASEGEGEGRRRRRGLQRLRGLFRSGRDAEDGPPRRRWAFWPTRRGAAAGMSRNAHK